MPAPARSPKILRFVQAVLVTSIVFLAGLSIWTLVWVVRWIADLGWSWAPLLHLLLLLAGLAGLAKLLLYVRAALKAGTHHRRSIPATVLRYVAAAPIGLAASLSVLLVCFVVVALVWSISGAGDPARRFKKPFRVPLRMPDGSARTLRVEWRKGEKRFAVVSEPDGAELPVESPGPGAFKHVVVTSKRELQGGCVGRTTLGFHMYGRPVGWLHHIATAPLMSRPAIKFPPRYEVTDAEGRLLWCFEHLQVKRLGDKRAQKDRSVTVIDFFADPPELSLELRRDRAVLRLRHSGEDMYGHLEGGDAGPRRIMALVRVEKDGENLWTPARIRYYSADKTHRFATPLPAGARVVVTVELPGWPGRLEASGTIE